MNEKNFFLSSVPSCLIFQAFSGILMYFYGGKLNKRGYRISKVAFLSVILLRIVSSYNIIRLHVIEYVCRGVLPCKRHVKLTPLVVYIQAYSGVTLTF